MLNKSNTDLPSEYSHATSLLPSHTVPCTPKHPPSSCRVPALITPKRTPAASKLMPTVVSTPQVCTCPEEQWTVDTHHHRPVASLSLIPSPNGFRMRPKSPNVYSTSRMLLPHSYLTHTSPPSRECTTIVCPPHPVPASLGPHRAPLVLFPSKECRSFEGHLSGVGGVVNEWMCSVWITSHCGVRVCMSSLGQRSSMSVTQGARGRGKR